MNIAVRAAPSRSGPDVARARDAARIGHLEVFSDLAQAQPFWRELEHNGALKTPYQSFDLLDAWVRNVGVSDGVEPFIVVGFDDANAPAFLWPLGRRRKGPFEVVSFLGGKHVNFNFALWRRDTAESLTPGDIGSVIARIGAASQPVDVLHLLNQPLSWDGVANPLVALQDQPSASGSRRLTLTSASGEDVIKSLLSPSMRARLRTKERRLQRLSNYRYTHATTTAEVDRLLDSFFPLKAAHMAAQGLSNIFAQSGHETFLRESCHCGLSEGKPLIEIHALEAGDELLALFAGISDGRRFSGMFNTYTLSDSARQSPGLILLVHLVSNLADRGFQSFDLGAGDAGYKSFFCKEPEPLFDSFVPLTPLGHVAAISSRLVYGLKRYIKQSGKLWDLIRTGRQRLRGNAVDSAGT